MSVAEQPTLNFKGNSWQLDKNIKIFNFILYIEYLLNDNVLLAIHSLRARYGYSWLQMTCSPSHCCLLNSLTANHIYHVVPMRAQTWPWLEFEFVYIIHTLHTHKKSSIHQHLFSLFLLVEVANFKVDKFNLLLYMLYWKETKEAKIKIAN